MHELRTALKSTPIVYITRDLERAIGLSDEYKNYYIVSNWSPWAKEYSKGKKNILLIKEKNILDTQELLEHKKTLQLLKKLKNFSILIFKNTSQIEKICHEHSWNLLNPNAELANRIEEKISQIEWLGPLKKYLPPHKVMLCKNLQWNKEKFILQFNRAHTGSGTILIESEKQIQELKQKFPNREVRVTQFIDGSAFTVNSVVWGNKVLVGNISYQIRKTNPRTQTKIPQPRSARHSIYRRLRVHSQQRRLGQQSTRRQHQLSNQKNKSKNSNKNSPTAKCASLNLSTAPRSQSTASSGATKYSSATSAIKSQASLLLPTKNSPPS